MVTGSSCRDNLHRAVMLTGAKIDVRLGFCPLFARTALMLSALAPPKEKLLYDWRRHSTSANFQQVIQSLAQRLDFIASLRSMVS